MKLHKILLEDSNIDEFLDNFCQIFPKAESFKDKIKEFITKSGCKKIEFKPSYAPTSLHNVVVITPECLNNTSIENALYVIFHEIAHQYQYRKYGDDFSYKLFIGAIPINDAVKILKKTENVADQFSIRKCREFAKLGLIDINKVPKNGNYKNITDSTFAYILNMFNKVLENNIEKIKREDGSIDTDVVSTILYNYITKSKWGDIKI